LRPQLIIHALHPTWLPTPPSVPLKRDYELEAASYKTPTRTTVHPLQRGKGAASAQTAAVPSAATAVKEVGADAKLEAKDPLSIAKAQAAGGDAASPAKSKPKDDPLSLMMRGGLKPTATATTEAAEDEEDDFDPLTMTRRKKATNKQSASELAAQQAAAVAAAAQKAQEEADRVFTDRDFEFWHEKCPRFLAKYTTSTTIAVDADFLSDGIGEAAGLGAEPTDKREGAASPASSTASSGLARKGDQTASRLEELTATEERTTAKAKSFLTQKEYIANIEDQHKRLKSAWDAGERVMALRIAIQCAIMLGDTSVPAFYPSMFVILTRLLDTFGELVFQGIKSKGVQMQDPITKQLITTALPNNFKSSDVCAAAKETCKNWFYKIVCIRELLPRLYIDLALIKCYRFLEDNSWVTNLARLSKAIRGIGDPLVATYARAFLTSKALDMSYAFLDPRPHPSQWTEIAPQYRPAVYDAFGDFLFTFQAHKRENFSNVPAVSSRKCTPEEYVDLFSPAVEWLVQNVAYRANEDLLSVIIQQYRDCCGNTMVLNHIINGFSPKFVAKNALSMIALIKEAEENPLNPRPVLFHSLGRALIKAAPPKEERLAILNDVWRFVTKIQDTKQYVDIALVFVEFLLLYFSPREVNIFLNDVIKHVKKEDAYKQFQGHLEGIAVKVVTHTTNLEQTLTMDSYLPLLDLLTRENKINVGKVALSTWESYGRTTGDPVIIHTLFDVAQALHDSITLQSAEGEVNEATNLINAFIRSLSYGRDLEAHFNTLVEFRGAFTSLDGVIVELVTQVCSLIARAHALMKGKHTKKTSGFVKTALAYCHITIPSLSDPFQKLRLYLLSAEVGLMNGMVVQSEAFIRAALSLVPEVPGQVILHSKTRSTDVQLVGYLQHLLSFLLLFPGHPKNGPFYLVHGLLNAVPKIVQWDQPQGSLPKLQVYLSALQLFSAYGQTTFIYHIDRVDSNDSLYASDQEYLAQLHTFMTRLVELIQEEIEKLGSAKDPPALKAQARAALDFVNVALNSLEMNSQTAQLVFDLIQLVVKTASLTTSAPAPAAQPEAPTNPLLSTFASITAQAQAHSQAAAIPYDRRYLVLTLQHLLQRSTKASMYLDVFNKLSELNVVPADIVAEARALDAKLVSQ